MTSTLEQACDLDLRGAFRRFYVWRDAAGLWRARPLPKLTAGEVAYGVLPELVADSLLQLAYRCTWQRSRRKVYRYVRKYGAGELEHDPAS
ncbi:hypothetical protein [Nonomuraea sp. NPDC050202]|jgi:hypothetical protein|uniref:hypothetical protein n=1 Tax=Nonomuraea sp. NPDC050202 TaxID=3155035 RepID=UPI0033CD3AAF